MITEINEDNSQHGIMSVASQTWLHSFNQAIEQDQYAELMLKLQPFDNDKECEN
jgi:hypothetical protein